MPKNSSAGGKIMAGPKRLSVEELEKILHAHSAFISHVAGGRRAMLKECDLSNVDLARRVLSDADLSGATLTGANLSFAEFVEANLYCCDMRGADGSYANFSHADMRGAVLSGCNLAHAKLNFADCRPGRMLQMSEAGPQDVISREAAANFSRSMLNDVNFDNARLEGADFSGAIIQASHFKGASLTNAVFEDAVVSGVDLDELRLPPAVLKTCVVAPSEQSIAARTRQLEKLGLHQRWVDSDSSQGRCAVFDGEDLRPLSDAVCKYKLTAISAKGAIAVMMDFSGAELQGANFENADLRGANFEGADLRGVRFGGARLDHAKFKSANMRPLLLKSGEKLACDLTGADVLDEQLEQAIRV